MDNQNRNVITANEIQLVDSKGRRSAVLAVDDLGFSALKLYDPSTQIVKVEISLDDKGSHCWMAGENKQQSYIFLKKTGASGLVLIDRDGVRRLEAMIDESTEPRVKTTTVDKEAHQL